MPLLENGEYVDTPYEKTFRKLYTYDQIKLPGIKTFGWQGVKSIIEVIPEHFHKDCFEIHYIIQGNHTFVVNDVEFPLKGGDIFITQPNELHKSGHSVIDARDMYWFSLSVNEDLLFLNKAKSNSIKRGLYNIKNRVISVGQDMKPLIREAFKHCTEGTEELQLHSSLQMAVFLCKLLEYDRKLKKSDISPEISFALSYIDTHIKKNLQIEEIASACNLSVSHFKRRFKNETGYTPLVYIQVNKIELAKKLLCDGLSVTETATALDYCSGNYFSTVFKRLTHITPSDYKKQNTTANR